MKGRLSDDTGRPLGQGRLSFASSGPLGVPTACNPTHPSQLRVVGGVINVDTDGNGGFCVTLSNVGTRGALDIEFDGDRFYDRASAHVDLAVSRRSLLLSFQSPPTALSLERETHALWIDAQIDPADDVGPTLQIRVSIEEDGLSRELARVATHPPEQAQVTLRSSSLGPPGPAHLIAEFAGSDSIQPARRAIPIQKTAHVTLSIPSAIPTADPQDGVDFDVAVGSALGAVPGGTVEALVNGESAGAAPVSAGSARVHASFVAPASGRVPMTLRYLPDAPWWLPAESLTVSVPIAPPSPWRRLPWVLAALLVAGWVVRTWWRPARTEKPDPKTLSLPPGRPSLEVLELGPVHSGWRGRVLDAHEANPIPDARVQIILPSFGEDVSPPSAVSDEDGFFELAPVERVEGARLSVQARWHSTLDRALPPPGHISVSLVSRRRALLARLVDWATRMGRPWSAPDPDPGLRRQDCQESASRGRGLLGSGGGTSGLRTGATG